MASSGLTFATLIPLHSFAAHAKHVIVTGVDPDAIAACFGTMRRAAYSSCLGNAAHVGDLSGFRSARLIMATRARPSPVIGALVTRSPGVVVVSRTSHSRDSSPQAP